MSRPNTFRPRSGKSPFDEIRHFETDPERGDFEYWSAREAMPYLGYASWQNMQNVLRKAKASCRNSGHSVACHFIDTIKTPSQGGPPQGDTHLSRLGMYLVAMNGDPDKPEIAAAQRYFAAQTYRAEQLLDPPIVDPVPSPSPTRAPEAWATRYRRSLMPHVRLLRNRYPGAFTVFSALVGDILTIEDELLRHLLPTNAFDRPDISIGLTWASHRRELGLENVTDSIPLFLPDRGTSVEVNVYGCKEMPAFYAFFIGVYLQTKLLNYLKHKPELKRFETLVKASVAENSCRAIAGESIVLPAKLRAELSKAGGFVPTALPLSDSTKRLV